MGSLLPATLGVPGLVDIAAIVTPTVQATTHGIVAAISAAHTVGTLVTGTSTLSPLKSLHFCKNYGTISDLEIPGIFLEVAGAISMQSRLAILVQYLMVGVVMCRLSF